MLVPTVLLLAALAPIARAATATIFPVGLGSGANLEGEVVGTGGEDGTTYILSGQTSGIAFTLTLAEDASRVSEHVAIPSASFELDVQCDISGDNAVCQNVRAQGTDFTTLAPTTIPFSPFAVSVSTGNRAASSTTSSASASATTTVAASTSTSVSHSVTIMSSVTPSVSATTSSGLSPSATRPGVASSLTSSSTSPSTSPSPTSGASKLFVTKVATIFPLVAVLWILA